MVDKNDFVARLQINIRKVAEVFYIFLCSKANEGYI